MTVNAVAPGFVDTDMTAGLSHDVRADHLAAIPMGRWAMPEEIVAPVLFLASAGASYITGTYWESMAAWAWGAEVVTRRRRW